MSALIPSMELFRPGATISIPEVGEQTRWIQWYEGHFQSLLPAQSTLNGLSLIAPGDLVTVPWFRTAAAFYETTVASERPAIDGSDQVLAWNERHGDEVWSALERAVQYWSIFDRAVLAVSESREVVAVNPLYYYRVGTWESRDELVGHIVAEPYWEGDSLHYSVVQAPNRIRVTRFSANHNDVATYEYAGSSGTGTVGPLIGREQAGVRTIVAVGDGRSWFPQVKRLAAAYMIRLTLMGLELNQYVNRPTSVPANVANDLRGHTGDTRSDAEVLRDFVNQVRPALTADKQDAQLGRVQETTASTEQRELADMIGHLLFISAGVPPSVFGLGISPDSSGVAREYSNDVASSRVRAFREACARKLPAVLRALGAPGRVQVTWAGNPLEHRTALVDDTLKLVQSGIITPEQAAVTLGYSQNRLGVRNEQTEASQRERPASQSRGNLQRSQAEHPSGR